MKDALRAVDLRQNNRNRIYRFIYDATAPVTKQEIASGLALSLPTVSTNLTEMMEEGFLSYCGTTVSTGGRKPRLITTVPAARYAVGIAVADDNVRYIAVDLALNELAFENIALPFSEECAYSDALAAHLEQFLSDHALDRDKLLGVGITIPGVVHTDRDLVEFAPTLGIRHRPFSIARDRFPYPSFLENDANASGFAEWWCRPDTVNLAYLSVERGVGGAILMNGTSYCGDHYRSGEFGHMCIVPDGKFCRCGRKGCLEAYCSTSILSDHLDLTLEEFFRKLDGGNEQLSVVWQEYLGHLSQGIVAIRAALDCDIILGGLLVPFLNERRLGELNRAIRAMDPFQPEGDAIRLGHFHSKSPCIGAALHYIQSFLQKI